MGFPDNENIRNLINELDTLKPGSVRIDLSALQNIDSAGIGMLMLIDDVAQEKGIALSLSGIGGQVEKVLNVCKLSEIMQIV